MNAGAYGNEISDQLIDVIYLNEAGRMSKASKDECAFSFRSSMFREKTSYVILSARFRLEPGDRQEINRKVQACQIDRATYQEMKYPNLGSLYKTKNIYGDIAKKSKLYKYFLWILNKIKRVLRLKNNVMINFFTAKYFKIKTVGKKAFSDKTLNCLVNRGDLSYTKALQFIDQISKILGDSVELEVEIIN
jgi:UDP-N-acetylenolpyruvoylglucosamine reductase